MTPSPSITREFVGEDLWDVRWSHDGAYLAVLSFDSVLLLDATGQQLHALSHGDSKVLAQAWSPARHELVTACDDGNVWICVLQEGRFRRAQQLKGHSGPVRALSWSPEGNLLASGGDDKHIRIWQMDTRKEQRAFEVSAEVRCVSWSPEGNALLWADTQNSLSLWPVAAAQATARALLESGADRICTVGWSRDGQVVAIGFGSGRVMMLSPDRPRAHRVETFCHSGIINAVAWHPKDTHVASAGDDWQVNVWSVQLRAAHADRDAQKIEPVRQQSFDGFNSKVTGLSWSPDGSRLACVSLDGMLQIHAISGAQETDPYVALQAATLGRRASRGAKAVSLSRGLERLPVILVQLQQLDVFTPLSWIEALLQLTSGRSNSPDLPVLKLHPGVQAVSALQWSLEARVGIVALLLREVPCAGDWQPPPELTRDGLVQGLRTALSGEEITPEAPPMLESAVARNADLLDEPFLRLLELLGPHVLAEEPGLVLRLRAQLKHVRPDTLPPRRLLGMRSRMVSSGRSSGQGGEGERMGLEQKGHLTQLLPWQLSLPPALLRYRQREGTLLYRAQSQTEPPRQRPLLLVLDASPAVYGPVEQLTRLAAHRIARTWLDAHRSVSLLMPGTSPVLQPLVREAELASIWTRRTLAPLDAEEVLSLAHEARLSLEGELEPLVLVLSHAWFGAESSRQTALPHTRALFVRLPGHRGTPPLASRCERWEVVSTGQPERLEEAVSRLLG